MADDDLLQRFIFENAPVRGESVYLRESYQTIINQHPYPEPIRKLLGEALSVATLLSAIIKFDGRLTVQFRGSGKLKLLLAQCTNQFHLRGLVKWDDSLLSYDDLMEAFNDGVLVIMLDGGPKSRYQGIVAWRGNSLAESIEGYFRESEQLATKIWLAVNEEASAGFLLQIVPGTENKELQEIHPEWERLVHRARHKIDDDDMLSLDGQALLEHLYADEDIRIFPPVPVAFNCTCTRKRGEDAISLLGRDEAEEELRNKNSIVVTCDFCNQEYVFDRADVNAIFERQTRPPGDNHLH
jgi:molecular chaperone Hsp33